MEKIAILGLWHQGIVGAACLADKGYLVTAADLNKENIKSLKSGKSPIYEPDLDILLDKGIASGKLNFTDNLEDAVVESDIVMLMFDIPVDDSDKVILDSFFETTRYIAPMMKDNSVIHITSQVPVGTSRKVKEILKEFNKSNVGISYSPENLRLGRAIELFLNPQLPIIGADSPETFDKIEKVFSSFKKNWDFVEIETAEMSKHVLNSYLAASVCFGNELGKICDEVGADGHKIAKLLRKEPRIGKEAMIIPGLAFSGGTLARDLQSLRKIASETDLEVPMLDGIVESNSNHNYIILRKLKHSFDDLSGLAVTILGLTYKPETSTLRRSASVDIVNKLLSEGAIVRSTDPMAERDLLTIKANFGFSREPYEAIERASAIVLMTPWKNYKNLDFTKIKKLMSENPVIIDPFNFWDSESLKSLGYVYKGIGMGDT